MRKQYNIEDLEFFYNARTLFYEIGYDDKPVKFHDAVSDNNGYLIHVGIRDGQYNICYYVFVDDGEIEECIAGQKLLLNALNNGNIEPIESGIDVENVFNSLNESTDNYQPKLYLRFEPPIHNDTIGIRQLDKILNLIENEYPTVSWFQGQEPSQYNPFIHENEDIPEQVKSITIGYWPDNPNLLTYGQWDDNDEGYTNAIDGWLWFEERDVDYDKTSDLFNSLNESDESRIPSAGDYLIFVGSEYGKWFHPLFTVGKVYKVFNTSEGIIEVQNDRGGLSNFSVDLLDNLNWETWFRLAKFDYDKTTEIFNQLNESETDFNPEVGDYLIAKDYPAIIKFLGDGLITVDKKYKITEIIPNYGVTIRNDNNHRHSFKFKTADKFFHLIKTNQFSNTEDIFSNLNESTRQPKLNLRFEDGISDADELDKVLEVLSLVYPGLKWMGGDPVTSHNVIRDVGEEEFRYDPIYYLTIGYFSHAPDKLTYTNGPADDIGYADEEQHNYNWVDGWQWVQENDINYDETSDIFNQLNESVQNYEPYTIIFDPPIEDPKTMEIVLMKLQTIHPEWTWVNNKRLIDYNPFDNEIQYDRYNGMYDSVVGNLTLNHPEWKDTKGLSWGSGDPDEPYFADVPKYNGWEYIKDLGDTPSTEDIFSQLD